MEYLEKLYEQECEGAIYSFSTGYIVIIYTCEPEGDRIGFTTDLNVAKEAIGWLE